MEKLSVSKVFVLHVKHGYDDRLISIKKQFSKRNIEFELITDGDMDDISQEQLDYYFSGEMHSVMPGSSCALKHFLAYENMLQNGISNALIFEDDIILANAFNYIFNQTIHEASIRTDIDDTMLFVSYENSTLRTIDRSKRVKGQFLYQGTTTRCAGAYFLTNKIASVFLTKVKTDKCDIPIDWFHNKVLEGQKIPIYWCHPAQAEQGSHNGLFRSAIDQKKSGHFRQFTWNVVKQYKSLIHKWK